MIDWSGWPLLEITADDLPDDAARDLVGKALTEALQRGGRFAAVVRVPPRSPGRARVRGAVDQVRMVRRLRPGLVDDCAGLAFVMTADSARDNAKLIKSGPKIWGCPVTAVTEPEQARAWARERLSDEAGRCGS